jgi:hypothetical protein
LKRGHGRGDVGRERPYKRDLKTIECHLLEAGHFALESDGDVIARLMLDFLDRRVVATANDGQSRVNAE